MSLSLLITGQGRGRGRTRTICRDATPRPTPLFEKDLKHER